MVIIEGVKCSRCHLGIDPKRSIPVRTRFCKHAHCVQCIVPWHKHIENQLPNNLNVRNLNIYNISEQDEDGQCGCPTCHKGAASTSREMYQLRNIVMPLCQFTKIEMLCVGGCKKRIIFRNLIIIYMWSSYL